MNQSSKNDTGRILGAIIGGCITVAISAFALTPLMYIVFDNFFSLNFIGLPSGGVGNVIIVMIACLAWLFISMYCGGYVGARIAFQKEYHIGWTITAIVALFYIVYARPEFRPSDFAVIFVTVFFGIIGILAGCHSGIKYKQRKKKEATILHKQRQTS